MWETWWFKGKTTKDPLKDISLSIPSYNVYTTIYLGIALLRITYNEKQRLQEKALTCEALSIICV